MWRQRTSKLSSLQQQSFFHKNHNLVCTAGKELEWVLAAGVCNKILEKESLFRFAGKIKESHDRNRWWCIKIGIAVVLHIMCATDSLNSIAHLSHSYRFSCKWKMLFTLAFWVCWGLTIILPIIGNTVVFFGAYGQIFIQRKDRLCYTIHACPCIYTILQYIHTLRSHLWQYYRSWGGWGIDWHHWLYY